MRFNFDLFGRHRLHILVVAAGSVLCAASYLLKILFIYLFVCLFVSSFVQSFVYLFMLVVASLFVVVAIY